MTRKNFITKGARYKDMAKGDSYKSLDGKIKQWIENMEGARPNGVFCTPVDEDVPTHEKAGCEIVYPGLISPHNTYIVLGRDRPESLASGCGGEGITQCGMIDIVVGKASSVIANMQKKKGGTGLSSDDLVGPNFNSDAARIYLTQRTSQKLGGIDAYFGLPVSPLFALETGNQSAIGIKADHTRIIGRNSVRIYAGSSRTVEGSPLPLGGETTANAEKLDAPCIELVAGNEMDIEPAILGWKLQAHLKKIHGHLQTLATDQQMIFKQLGWLNFSQFKSDPFGPWIIHGIKDIGGYIDKIITGYNLTIDAINDLDDAMISGATSIISNTVRIT